MKKYLKFKIELLNTAKISKSMPKNWKSHIRLMAFATKNLLTSMKKVKRIFVKEVWKGTSKNLHNCLII